MKRKELETRQNWVVYTLMAVTAIVALVVALWYHARHL